MKLWLKITQGLAALLLSAAALSLLLFAGALLLGLAAVVLIAAAGLFLAAPDESKQTLQRFMSRIDEWIGAMKGIVESAGEVVLTLMGAARGGRPEGENPQQTPAEAAPQPAPSAPRAAPAAPSDATVSQDAAPPAEDHPQAVKPSSR